VSLWGRGNAWPRSAFPVLLTRLSLDPTRLITELSPRHRRTGLHPRGLSLWPSSPLCERSESKRVDTSAKQHVAWLPWAGVSASRTRARVPVCIHELVGMCVREFAFEWACMREYG
jgi:hypothetical protein